MSLDLHDPQPKYIWICGYCKFEDHGDMWRYGGKRITPRLIELHIDNPIECPQCSKKEFRIIEL